MLDSIKPPTDAEIKTRMRQRLRSLGWTLEDVSASTGASYRNVRNWISGETRLPARFVAEFVQVVPVEERWLLSGEGSPEPTGGGTGELVNQVIRATVRVSEDRLTPVAERRRRLEAALRGLES